jgi:hypothetical protein
MLVLELLLGILFGLVTGFTQEHHDGNNMILFNISKNQCFHVAWAWVVDRSQARTFTQVWFWNGTVARTFARILSKGAAHG